MASQPRFLPDVATDNAVLLGHDRTVASLLAVLDDDEARGPMSISLDGKWGSGKTSILRTVERLADHDKIDVLFFEAWKYEYSNPAVGLVSELAHKYYSESSHKETLKKAVLAAAHVASSKFLGTSVVEIAEIMSGPPAAKTLSDSLSDIVRNRTGGKKLVVMIDDLDRCDPENALQVLSLAKMFLGIEGCICIAAMDMSQIRRAWSVKYRGRPDDAGDAGGYLGKIFQSGMRVPEPSVEQVEAYVNEIAGGASSSAAAAVAQLVKRNPRVIKHMYNAVNQRARALASPTGGLSALVWTLLEASTSDGFAGRTYSRLGEIGTSMGKLMAGAGGGGHGLDSVKGELSALFGNELVSEDENNLAFVVAYARAAAAGSSATSAGLDRDFAALRAVTVGG